MRKTCSSDFPETNLHIIAALQNPGGSPRELPAAAVAVHAALRSVDAYADKVQLLAEQIRRQ